MLVESPAYTVGEDASLSGVARVLVEDNVTAVAVVGRSEHIVVTEDAGQVVGVVTARDVARHCCDY